MGHSLDEGSICSGGGVVSSDVINRSVSWTWGWRSILMLQFQMQFSIAISVSIVIGCVIVLSEAAYALGTTHPEEVTINYSSFTIYMLYAFDVVYLIDLLLMTIYKNMKWTEVNWKYAPREHIILIIEYLSLVPIDGMYYSFSTAQLKVLYALRIRYAVRIFRLLMYYRGRSSTFLKSYLVHITLLLVVVTVMTTVASVIAYIVTCDNCEYMDTDRFKKICYMFLSKITEMGTSKESSEALSTELLFLIGVLLFLCNMYLTSNFICDIVILIEEKFFLVNSFERVKIRIARAGFFRRARDPYKYVKLIQSCYSVFWQKKKGITPNFVFNSRYLPEIKSKEIFLDMSWAALKHSHFFRDQQTHFLRYLSMYIQHIYMMPGDAIYQKGQLKSKFVYVVSGVVQILSNEDNETPIISLSDGTCFGETSLFVNHKSTATVTCKDYCELAILERKHFIKIAQLYPDQIRNLLNLTIRRYKYVNYFTTVARLQIEDKVELEEMHITCLKYTLRKLLFGEIKADSRQTIKILESTVFCTKFLDMLAIAQEIKLVTDTVFLKKTFPFIFQPNSPVLIGWNRLITLIFFVHAFIYLYNVTVAARITTTYIMYHVVISVFWALDLYVEISTAVQTSQHFLVTITDIISYKLRHITFLFKIISALCPGLYLKLTQPNVSTRYVLLFECNKLLKVYKVEQFFESIKSSTMSKMVALVYLKFIIYMLLLLLYLGGLLVLTVCFDWKCTEKFKTFALGNGFFDSIGLLRYGLLQTIYFFCNFQTTFDQFHSYNELLLMQCVLFLFQLIFTAYRTAAEALRRYDVQYLSDYVRRFKLILRGLNNEKMFYRYPHTNIMLQYKYDGINFLYMDELYKVLPYSYLNIIRNIINSEEILKIPIFANATKQETEQISMLIQSMVLCKGSLVISEGEICLKLYLIRLGNCLIKSHNTAPRILGPGDSFCVFEACMQTTSFNTVETLTTCQILILNTSKIQKVVLSNYEFYSAMKRTMTEFRTELKSLPPVEIVLYELPKKFKKKTLMEKLGIRKVKIERKDLPKWGVRLRFILIPYTFRTHGRFIVYWEISRWVFAVVAAFLVHVITVSCTASTAYIMMGFLDCVSWIDIYIRHHVVYYNKYGVEVSHPYYTSVYYWKHAFILDLLAAFPIDSIYHLATGGETKIPLAFRANKLLQLYRINGVVEYFSLFNIAQIKMVESLKYATLAMVAISLISANHFNAVCTMSADCITTCHTGLLSANHTNDTTITSYTILFLFSASLFFNNFYDFGAIKARAEESMLIFVGLMGYLFWAYVSSNIVAVNLSRNFHLISQQNAMKDLLKFMKMRRVDKRLKNEIVAYFEYMWLRKQGIRIHKLLYHFPYPTKKIILFEVFGLRMLQSSIFSTASEAVIRNILIGVKHEVILKNGILYKVNDVIGKMFFIYRGKVEVIGADGNHLQFLPEGSMVGNLDNIHMSRQTLTMTAYGHVEILVISSVKFHEILSKYPPIYQKFLRLTSINVDFLKNEAEESAKLAKKKVTARKKVAKILRTDLWMRVWKQVMGVLALLSYVLELYHICTLHNSVLLILVLYLIDALYVLRIIFKFNTAYIDEFGIVIKTKSMIAARYKRTSLTYDLCTTIPIELISIFFIGYGAKTFNLWWTYLRVNRVLRIGYTMTQTKLMIHKLNTNAFWVRTAYCTLMLFVYLILLSCILCFVDSYYFDLDAMTGEEKFYFYFSYFKTILQMIAKTTISYELDQLHPTFTFILAWCMLLSKWMAIHYMAHIVSMTQIVNNRRSLFESFSMKLKTFMDYQYLSPPLKDANNEYLSSLWNHYDGEQLPHLLTEAPYYLKEGVLNSMFGVHLRNHPAFKQCHVDFIRQVSACFNAVRFFPGDIITYIGDIDHCMYFIHRGVVEMLSEDSVYDEEVDYVLNEGHMFGFDQGIYMRIGHTHTYKVSQKALILVLKREDWIHLLRFYPASKLHLYDKSKEI